MLRLTSSILALSICLVCATAEAAKAPKRASKPVAKTSSKNATKAKVTAPVARAKVAAPASRGRAPASVTAAKSGKPETSYKVRMPAAAAFLPSSGGNGMTTIGGVAESDRAIQIMGQARNLSMMLTLRNEKDRIKFVEVRRDFRPEIEQTQY